MSISNLLILMFTQENFLALIKRCLKLIGLVFLFLLGTKIFSQDWYISNAAGMALEKTFSRAALREDYALKIEYRGPDRIPPEIAVFIDPSAVVPESYNVELHTLYKDAGEESRRWIFRYPRGNPWIVISINEQASGGFAEYYDESDLLIQEDAFQGENVISNRHSYNDGVLLKSETWRIPQKRGENISNGSEESEESDETAMHLWSDIYRYARTGALRSIERIFHSDETESVRFARFPPLGPGYEQNSFVNAVPAVSSDLISDVLYLMSDTVEYVRDSKGRIVSEIHKDAEGRITGELINTWSGERLASIAWNGENDTRLVEYEYDAQGNRIIERNYRGGILERLIRTEEDQEVEELYLQGKLSLRAIWKDGQKISEEFFWQNSRRIP